MPDFSDPTDPRALALRFIELNHWAEWTPEDRPAWPGSIGSMLFRQWCADRLPELDALVKIDQKRSITKTVTPEMEERMTNSFTDANWGRLSARIGVIEHSLSRDGKRPTDHAIFNALKRLDEPKRDGPTRGGESPAQDAIKAAGWDIWKLRIVILPRFWPDDAVGKFRLGKNELAKVAAKRHDCTASQAARQYLDEGLATIHTR